YEHVSQGVSGSKSVARRGGEPERAVLIVAGPRSCTDVDLVQVVLPDVLEICSEFDGVRAADPTEIVLELPVRHTVASRVGTAVYRCYAGHDHRRNFVNQFFIVAEQVRKVDTELSAGVILERAGEGFHQAGIRSRRSAEAERVQLGRAHRGGYIERGRAANDFRVDGSRRKIGDAVAETMVHRVESAPEDTGAAFEIVYSKRAGADILHRRRHLPKIERWLANHVG